MGVSLGVGGCHEHGGWLYVNRVDRRRCRTCDRSRRRRGLDGPQSGTGSRTRARRLSPPAHLSVRGPPSPSTRTTLPSLACPCAHGTLCAASPSSAVAAAGGSSMEPRMRRRRCCSRPGSWSSTRGGTTASRCALITPSPEVEAEQLADALFWTAAVDTRSEHRPGGGVHAQDAAGRTEVRGVGGARVRSAVGLTAGDVGWA